MSHAARSSFTPPPETAEHDRARMARLRARLETAIARGIDLLDRFDAQLEDREDDEPEDDDREDEGRKIYMEDCR